MTEEPIIIFTDGGCEKSRDKVTLIDAQFRFVREVDVLIEQVIWFIDVNR